MMPDKEARRRARARWETCLQSREDPDDEARFWLRIPVDERARETWVASRELYALALCNGGVLDEERGLIIEGKPSEPRLPRSAYRVHRR